MINTFYESLVLFIISSISFHCDSQQIGKIDCGAFCHKLFLSFSRKAGSCSWITNDKVQHFLRKSCTVHHQLIPFLVILSKSCTVHHPLISFVVILSKSRTVHHPLISFIVILSKSCTAPHPLSSFIVILSKSCTIHHPLNLPL
jgi:hypothetical protein